MKNVNVTKCGWLAVLVVASALSGCKRDVQLAGTKLRSVTVKPVTHYGVSLDQNATPEQVAFVALRAVREDFLAETADAREAALDVQFDVSAASILGRMSRSARTSEEWLHHVVYRWTPTVSHYVGDFPESPADANARLSRTKSRFKENAGDRIELCDVLMEAADPSGDSSAQVVMVIHMARDSGLWRVLNFGFDSNRRSIVSKNSK